MEYSILTLVAFAASTYLITRLAIPEKPLWVALAIAVFFQLVFDNLMTAQGLWAFDFSKTVGVAIPYIPLENLVFGASLFLFTVWSWEKTK